ncbi:MAG: tyrosine--tRNA ligase [Candidatus Micrarchaeota archaeon]
MDAENRLELALRPPTQEVVEEGELRELFETKREPVHYIGLEVSGRLHVGSLLLNGFKINDLKKAGCKTQVFLADWHSVINRKLGGDWEKIAAASKYYEEAFSFFCPGAQIRTGSQLYAGNDAYWKDVVSFSQHATLKRATRCLTIMGRSENESLDLAQYYYPPMQAVDIRHLGADIAHAGMDQRKIHMLAREVFPKMGWKKPIALHHFILSGLSEPPKSEGETKEDEVFESKMSKSKPDSAIFIHDSPAEIQRKMSKAYCPPAVEKNPVLEMAKFIAFREAGAVLKVERPAKFGGDVEYESYAALEAAYAEKKLHAMDLKKAVGNAIDAALAPVRSHFEKRPQLLEVFNETKVTR